MAPNLFNNVLRLLTNLLEQNLFECNRPYKLQWHCNTLRMLEMLGSPN